MKPSLSLLASSLFLFGAIGCGSGPSTDLDACRQRAPSIATGIYGCTTSTSDEGDTTTYVLPDFQVQVFTSEPSGMQNDGAVPAWSTASDADGFYELSLAPGHYWICSGFRRCTEQKLGAAPRRLDYSFSLGPGWQE
jgi:hypothetical protein